jgi:hypothetical protein
MEEIWLQTRPRSEREKRFVEDIERIQGEIWQTLRIAEWQKAYSDAKVALPAKARVLLDPFEDLSSKILLTRKDLDVFLTQWEGLQSRLQDLYRRLSSEEGPAKKWLDHLHGLHENSWQSRKVQEWREAYAGFRESLPSRVQLLYVKYDALTNRVVYSRQDLKRFWTRTREDLRGRRFLGIQPFRLATTFCKEVYLTTAFAGKVLSSYRS